VTLRAAAQPTAVEVLRRAAREHHAWRARSLNLCAAETMTSHLVRELLASDFGRRYATRTGAYSGARYVDEIEAACEASARRVFGCDFASIAPISGHISLLATVIALTTRGSRVITTAPEAGGYPIRLAERIGLDVTYFPLDETGLGIDAERAGDVIRETRPRLVIFGASEFLFPPPLDELVPVCREVGALAAYDASHPMGLIAGGEFQLPFRSGVDVIFGSTNKTFFGPHRGLVLTRVDGDLHRSITDLLDAPPFFQSSHHVNTAVALAAAMAETEAFGRDYAAAVVANARALARAIAAEGVDVLGAAEGFTCSHQILLECGGYGSNAAIELQHRLEDASILADLVVRFGTQQVTRVGMGETEMKAIAELIADVVLRRREAGDVRADVAALASGFRTLRFCFEPDAEAFAQLLFDPDRTTR
jgi:glycine hydroxymethyltransferase